MRIIANRIKFKRGFLNKLKAFIKDNFSDIAEHLEIVFVSGNTMRKYNARFTNTSSVTDVLSFDIDGDYIIIVCPDVARKNAILFGEWFENELVLYIVHGILHLVGYDHKVKGKEKTMREKERELVKKWKAFYYS